jgi:hypothetical protein
MTDLLTGIAVLTSVSALFGLGWYLGRHTETQHRVDAALRRETRLRHPLAQAAPHLRDRGLISARTADLLTDGDPQVTASVGARLGLSAREALSVSVRPYVRPVSVSPAVRRYAASDTARGPEC